MTEDFRAWEWWATVQAEVREVDLGQGSEKELAAR